MIFDLHNGNFNIPITYIYEKHTPNPLERGVCIGSDHRLKEE